MSAKKKFNMTISMPPRRHTVLSFQDSDALPSPHTPIPYTYGSPSEGLEPNFGSSSSPSTPGSSSSGKRPRDGSEDPEDIAWTQEEISAVERVLANPIQPLSSPFPPGELPPTHIIDQLTAQVMKYGSKPRHGYGSADSQTHVAMVEADCTWRHSWDRTRRKVFETALNASQRAHGLEDAKLPRGERRPNLRRVDSMDFLTTDEDEDTRVKRAINLSTELQNSMGTLSPPATVDGSTTPTMQVTPPTPKSKLRRSDSHVRRLEKKASRPSLLQRGRSFTAGDLEAEEASQIQKDATETPPVAPARRPKMGLRSSSSLLVPLTRTNPGLSRSQSTSILIPSNGDSVAMDAQNRNDAPSTTGLATPMVLGQPERIGSSGGWSDSEDEGVTRSRTLKKAKPPSRHGTKVAVLQAQMMGVALRSPFEERSGFEL